MITSRGLTGKTLPVNGRNVSDEEKIYMQNCH